MGEIQVDDAGKIKSRSEGDSLRFECDVASKGQGVRAGDSFAEVTLIICIRMTKREFWPLCKFLF